MERNSVIVTVVALVAIVAIVLLVIRQPGSSSTSTPGASGMVTANIVATGASNLAGVQVDVLYNPAVVQFVGVDEGPFLDQGNPDSAMLLQTATAESGVVKNIIILKLGGAGVTGSGTLGTLRFNRITAGDAGIRLGDVLVSDANSQHLPASILSIQ